MVSVRNLIIIGVVVVIAGYFILSSVSSSFSDDYADLSRVWREKGITNTEFHSGFDVISNLSENELKSMQADFDEKQSSSTGSIKNLAGAYSDLTGVALNLKENESLQSSINTSPEVCDMVSYQKEINANFVEINSIYKTYSQRINVFVSNNPNEAADIKLTSISSDFLISEADITEGQGLVAFIGADC